MSIVQITDYEDLISIVSDPAAKIVIEVKHISEDQKKLIELIADIFEAAPLKYGESRTLNDTFDALKKWWSNIPSVSRISTLYAVNTQSTLAKFIELNNSLVGNVDKFNLLFDSIPSIYADAIFEKDINKDIIASVSELLKKDVETLNSGYHTARSKVVEGICGLFNVKGDMVTCKDSFTSWHESLTPYQRNPNKYHNPDCRNLLTHISKNSEDFEKSIMKLIPYDFGLGTVVDWTSLLFEEYNSKISQSKIEIDKNIIEVNKPPIEETVHDIQPTVPKTLNLPEGAKKFIYTIDGSDPKISETRKELDTSIKLNDILGDKNKVTVEMRSVDLEGNTSELVKFELANKQKEYNLEIKKGVFGGREASFKFPEDISGINTVLQSFFKYCVKYKIIDDSKEKSLNEELRKILLEKDQG